VVPSSNVTMETEVPAMLRRREEQRAEGFTFHSARVRMRHVNPAELKAMNDQAATAVELLSDADCDVIAYACLVAAMADPRGYAAVEDDMRKAQAGRARHVPVISSAGALVDAIRHLGARRVAIVAPYKPQLTQLVITTLASEGIQVLDSRSLGVDDNLQVARLPVGQLPDVVASLDLDRADAVVLSACVQMPSLASIPVVESQTGLPVVTAASATTWKILSTLGLDGAVTDAGSLLAG
jgi:maleate isomerase